MIVLAALAVFLLLAAPAAADMFPDASNAKLPQARQNLGAGNPISIKDYGARADAVTGADGVVAVSGVGLTSASVTFTQADVGKKIQIDGAAGLLGPPLKTTIVAVVDAHTVTLGTPATAQAPRYYYASAGVLTPRTAGNYVPGDVLTLQGGAFSTAATATVGITKVTAATIAAPGAGGVNGACVLRGTTGNGTLVRVNATIAGGAVTAITGILDAGHYAVKPTNLAAEPVSNQPGGACAPTGATLNLTMGAEIVIVNNPGNYSATPADPVATGAGSISGATGATLSVTWNPSGAFVYGSDDSQALKDAIDAATAAFAVGKPAYVFIPAGNYLIDSTPTPLMRSGLGVIGEGTTKTNLILGADYSGDLFSWSEAWIATSYRLNGTAAQVSSWKAGPKAVGFSVWGNRTAGATQNALVFYDRVDQVVIDDVDVNFINGRCLYSGKTLEAVTAAMRESRLGRIRCYMIGAANVPAIEFTSEGGGDATNEVNIGDIDIYAPFGPGFVIRNANTTNGLRGIRIDKLRVEGLQAGNVTGDLVRLGDPVLAGVVHDVYFNQLELVDPYINGAALRVASPSLGSNPYLIQVAAGSIGGGLPLGYGVALDGGRDMSFGFSNIYSWRPNFSMGSLAFSTVLDGAGQERYWTYVLADPLQLGVPLRRISSPNPQGGMVTSCAGLGSGTLWNNAGVVNVCP